MFESFKQKAAELVDHLGRSISNTEPVVEDDLLEVSPFDDPRVWIQEPCYEPPMSQSGIANAQRWIDSIIGTTRENQSICKLVWNGDRNYWFEYFLEWNALGRPSAPIYRRPRLRYSKLMNKKTRKIIRDVFPPRWLLLWRLEPEQYAATWKEQSWVPAPELSGWTEKLEPKTGEPQRDPFTGEIQYECRNVFKQIRPDEPPPVFWMWGMTIAYHSNFCCSTAAKEQYRCYGKYTEPYLAKEYLEGKAREMQEQGTRNPFAKIDGQFIRSSNDEENGYEQELIELEAEAAVSMENPFALVGVHGSLRAGLANEKQARQMVKDHFDRDRERLAKVHANIGEL